MSRMSVQECALLSKQDIEEVWFRGYHSDVGCGQIALRWMLGEAACAQIELNDKGWLPARDEGRGARDA